MRSSRHRLIPLVALMAALAAKQVARGADPDKPKGNGKAKPEKVDKPDRPDKNGNSGNSDGGNGNGDKNGKNSDAHLKSEFKAQADALQKKQKELLDKLKNANAEERARIRDQLQTLKENWKELNR